MKFKKHIPNILSSIRLTSPLVLIPLITTGNYMFAFISLCIFLLTDAVDGHLARKLNVESSLGAKIDAVSDKLLLGSLLIPLAINNPIVIINLVFELLISIVTIIRKVKGGNPKTHQLGRIKMVVISMFTGLSYLAKLVPINIILLNLCSIITALLQLTSLTQYIDNTKKELKKLDIKKYLDKLEEQDKKEKDKEKVLEKDYIAKKSLEDQKNELLHLKEEILSFNEDDNIDLQPPKVKRK